MGDSDLCYLPAHDLIRRFKAKSLSPVELLEALIARAEKVREPVNCLTYTHFDSAMAAARKAEARYARGARTRPLEGLPVAIKDESFIKGMPTSNGSLLMRDFVAEATSTVNARILRAGGIVHARTATPEFSCAGYTWSRLWGVTRNPWNRDYTPGGSSGGSGAALAAGLAPLATGSDIGGSIRIPASATGTVGYKPPYGRVPEDPPFNLDFYCHNGPMTRTVRDAILLQNVIAGPSETDVASLRPKLRLPVEYKPVRGWKIAWSMDMGLFEVDDEVQRNTKAALDVFRELGAETVEVTLDWPKDVRSAGLGYLSQIFGAYLGKSVEGHEADLTDYARHFVELGRGARPEAFVHSLEVVGAMYASFGPMMAKHDLFICPTLVVPAVPAEYNQARDTFQVNGREVDPILGWAMTLPFNMLSRCPVLSVPSGRAKNGVPTGIQLVGRTYRDADVFRAGLAYETALGGWFTGQAARPAI
ncbi:MAG: amidase [Rhodobacteraceae bacterium]|nr:amidase [Paracoccaceae bacterium]